MPIDSTSRRPRKLPTHSINEAVVSSPCWSCGVSLYEVVHWSRTHHQHLSWSCDTCAVTWVGPGTRVDDHQAAS